MKSKDRPKPPEPEPVERDDVRVSANRCPFCHEDVQVKPFDWVSCGSCQARHHDACWEEGGACGSCGERTRLVPEASGLGQQASEEVASTAGVLLSVILGGVLVFWNTSPSGNRFLFYLGLFWLSTPLLVAMQGAIRKKIATGK